MLKLHEISVNFMVIFIDHQLLQTFYVFCSLRMCQSEIALTHEDFLVKKIWRRHLKSSTFV